MNFSFKPWATHKTSEKFTMKYYKNLLNEQLLRYLSKIPLHSKENHFPKELRIWVNSLHIPAATLERLLITLIDISS